MFEKEIKELQHKLEELNQQMLDATQNEAKKYLNVFTKYVNIDFDYFKPSCKLQNGYGSDSNITFEQHGFQSSSWIPRAKQLFNIRISNDNGEILGIDDYSGFDLDFRNFDNSDTEFMIKRSELVLNVKKAVIKHKEQIQTEFIKVRSEDSIGVMMEKEKLLHYMNNFLRDNAEHGLKIDEMFANKGYKADRSIGFTKFDGNYGYADEISFFKNPSGTYTITLKDNGNISSQSQRASYDNLMSLLKAFANA